MGIFGSLGRMLVGGSPQLPPGMTGQQLPTGVYDPSQASGSDKLMMAGAMMRDIGSQLRGNDSNDILAMQQLLAQRQIMAARNAFLMRHMGGAGGAGAGVAGGAGVGAASGGAPSGPSGPAYSPDDEMIGANALGLKFDDYNTALKNNAPFYQDGVRVNGPYDPNAPKFIPKAQDGMQPIFGDGGAFRGVDVQPGATATAQALANATSMGQEGAKAFYRTDQIPTSGGSMENVPGDLANAYLRDRFIRKYGVPGSGPVVPQAGGAPAAPGVGGGYSATPAGAGTDADTGELGRTPTDAEKTLSTARATTQGEREKLQPKELGGLQDLDNTSAQTSQILHHILGDVQDPKTGKWIVGSNPQATKWTTGAMGALLHEVPGTPQHDLNEQLEHLRAMTSMEQLQNLRDNSPTGAGLGKVTQAEIDLLAAMRGSVDQGQRLPQFNQNMRRQLTMLDQMVANRRKVFSDTYNGIQQPQPGATQPVVPRAVAGAQRGGGGGSSSTGYKVLGVRRGGQ